MKTLTKEMQAALTPAQAVELLKAGNKRFIDNVSINRNFLQQLNETYDGQYPFATILSCIDSRTPAETIFDQGLGDIFSIRIAGNILNDDILGSMEFACNVAGSKLIVVLGHTKCGAIQGACEHVEMGNLTGLLHKVGPAIAMAESVEKFDAQNKTEFVNKVAEQNVKLVIEQILQRSFIIKEMLETKKIGLIGGMYDIKTGKVCFFNSED